MDLLKYFNIRETYQLPDALMNCVLNKDSLQALCKAYKTEYQDLSVDVFRDKFQDEHANRTAFMQDFTPDCIGEILSGICPEADSAADICAGTGGLTIKIWNKNPKATFTCFELSERVLPILLFNLAVRNIEAAVWYGDVITQEFFKIYHIHNNEITVSEPNAEIMPKCDMVVSNPPYSLKWNPPENDARMPFGIPPKSLADYAFVQIGLSLLKKGGKGFFILPDGVLSRSNNEGKIRENMLNAGLFKTIIKLPSNLFKNTTIPVNLIEMQA